MAIEDFTAHHVTLSIRSLNASVDFYGWLGFRTLLRWDSADDDLTIVHLSSADGHLILELFCYAENSFEPSLSLSAGNDLTAVGVKHFALQVADLKSLHERALDEWGESSVTELTVGRTGIQYFFLRDPDGMWVEIAEDHRALDPTSPKIIRESS